MEKISKYIALDGKEFDDVDKCADYEINLFIPDEKELILLNESLEVMPISVASVCDCSYMSIKSGRALKYVEMISDLYGYSVPCKCGNFFYGSDWTDVQKIFDDAIKLAKAFSVKLTEDSR